MSLFDFSKINSGVRNWQKKTKGRNRNSLPANSVAYTKGLTATANLGSGQGSPGGGGIGLGGSVNSNVYNPVYDDLSEGSIVERWIPRQAASLNKMFRLIYVRDPVCGPVVDLISTLPFSEFALAGIKDRKILKLYEDSLSDLGIEEMLPGIAVDFLILGKVCASLVFNEDKGYFTNMVVHDPDFLRITPIPIAGFDPKIDGRVSPGQKQFLFSQDPRDQNARALLPQQFLDSMQSGDYMPLDPLTTLYLPRKAGINDFVGTSFYTRVLTLWALEKSIINANVSSVRRRAGAILHVTAGIQDVWEPLAEEIDAISEAFIKAEEDPVGAIVVTRQGVETNEPRDGSLSWKMSDEWAYLSEAKLRSLGLSESFLSGEATYNNTEQALSVFTESLREFRKMMTNAIFYNKIFRYIAKANGFVKVSKADLEHNVRTTDKTKKDNGSDDSMTQEDGVLIDQKRLSVKESKSLSNKDLIIPEIQWAKQLRPDIDISYLDVLDKLEEKGIPVPLKTWAKTGGQDIDTLIGELEDDSVSRKKIKDVKKAYGPGEEEDAFGSKRDFQDSSINPKPVVTKQNYRRLLGKLPLFSKGSFISRSEAEDIIKELLNNKYTETEKIRYVEKVTKGNEGKFEETNYILSRLGLVNGKAKVSKSTLKNISERVLFDGNGEKASLEELEYLQIMSKKLKNRDSKDNRTKMIPGNSKNIFSGE